MPRNTALGILIDLSHARRLAIVVLGALAGAGPVAGQPTPQRDPLGIGREFDASIDPAKANEMIRECDGQTQRMKGAIVNWRETVDRYREALAAAERQRIEVSQAIDAFREAETRARSLSGAQATQFETNILQPRRERLRVARERGADASLRFDEARARFGRDADSTRDFFRSIGLQDGDMAGSPDDILHRQTERCERLRAWSRQGFETRMRLQPSAQPGAWPDGAIGAWRGQWSCRWQSTVRGETVTTTVATKINAWSEDINTVRVHLSTASTSGWSSAHPSHVFSPLAVKKSQPLHGAFTNRPEFDEGRVRHDAIDTGDVTLDGRLTFSRRYGTSPGDGERLECTRAG